MKFGTAGITLALASVLMGGVSANAQNLIINPGFEAGGVGVGTAIPGWTKTGNVNPEAYATYVGFGVPGSKLPTAAYGNNFVAFNDGNNTTVDGVLSQTLTGLTVGTVYNVGFSFGNFNAANNNAADTQSITAAVTSVGITLASLPVTDFEATTQTDFTAINKPRSFFFTATGATATLSFTDTTPLSQVVQADGVLDNVSVTAVPEAGALSLLAAGIAAGAGLLLRRRAA